MKASSALAASLACTALGCLGPPLDTLRARAALDLRCPADQLVLTRLAGSPITMEELPVVEGVAGCGRRASYQYSVSAGVWMGTGGWMGIGDDPEPAPPATAPPAGPSL
jgi:hypothetical protein